MPALAAVHARTQCSLPMYRPIYVNVQNPTMFSDNLTIFTASTGQQISSSYPEKKHGLFTYYLLKGLRGDADKNGDESLTVEELEEYVITNVKKTAGLLDREQTPQVFAKDKSRVLVKY